MQFWITRAFIGIAYGALLFMLASALSLIFGVKGIVKLAHGSYFLLGGYVPLTISWHTGSWPLAIPSKRLCSGVARDTYGTHTAASPRETFVKSC